VRVATRRPAEILLHPGGQASWPHLLRLRELLDGMLSIPLLQPAL
jgi:hypothetical protein